MVDRISWLQNLARYYKTHFSLVLCLGSIFSYFECIDIERKNRLLKFCYVPNTSKTFLGFFLLWPLTVLMKQPRQALCAIKQSILVRCLYVDKMNWPCDSNWQCLLRFVDLRNIVNGKKRRNVRPFFRRSYYGDVVFVLKRQTVFTLKRIVLV